MPASKNAFEAHKIVLFLCLDSPFHYVNTHKHTHTHTHTHTNKQTARKPRQDTHICTLSHIHKNIKLKIPKSDAILSPHKTNSLMTDTYSSSVFTENNPIVVKQSRNTYSASVMQSLPIHNKIVRKE